MRAGAADGHVEIEIDRLSARRKSNGRQARPARTGRVARAEVRHRQVVAPPTIAGAEPVALSTVHVRETAPPPGEPAVEWFLLTSLDVDSTETAVAAARCAIWWSRRTGCSARSGFRRRRCICGRARRGWDGAMSNAKPICTGCCA